MRTALDLNLGHHPVRGHVDARVQALITELTSQPANR
jgi:hypothetical protein